MILVALTQQTGPYPDGMLAVSAVMFGLATLISVVSMGLLASYVEADHFMPLAGQGTLRTAEGAFVASVMCKVLVLMGVPSSPCGSPFRWECSS